LGYTKNAAIFGWVVGTKKGGFCAQALFLGGGGGVRMA